MDEIKRNEAIQGNSMCTVDVLYVGKNEQNPQGMEKFHTLRVCLICIKNDR